MTLVFAARAVVPAKSIVPWSTCNDPPAGTPAALATSFREVKPETLTEPIVHEPSTSMSRLPR